MKAERKCCLQIILSLLKEKVAKQPLGAEDLAAAATVAVGADVAPKVSAMSVAMAHEGHAMCFMARHECLHILSLEVCRVAVSWSMSHH